MYYSDKDIPKISNTYSFQNDFDNGRVLCTAQGNVKVLNCDPSILEEVLSHVDGRNSLNDIEM